MTIAIVDYGVGNLASVRKALAAVGAHSELVGDPHALASATAMVLPGVGHFGHCARELERHAFGPALQAARQRGIPILGICVGMQLFFDGSDEAEGEAGLGLLSGRVRRMREVPRLPQIGWNRVRIAGGWRGRRPACGIEPGAVRDGDFFYFVHSYAAEPDPAIVLGTIQYGGERAAIVGQDGLLGVQFHPEKSGTGGLRLLRAWARSVGATTGERTEALVAAVPAAAGAAGLAKRIIPCLDVRDGRVVKGTRFVELRDAGDAVELARRYDEQGADELVFLDITASAERRRTMVELASRVADELRIPFTVGGGIRSADEAGEILRTGADKVAVNSAAVRDPGLIAGIASRFGSQACVLAIDARRRDVGRSRSPAPSASGRYEVVIDGGRLPTGRDVLEWASEGVERGAGEILLTSMDTDGTKLGFDLHLTAAVASAVDVPVIASGGASSPADFVTLFERTTAEAGLAASIFHFSETTVGEVKDALARARLPVRPAELGSVGR